MIALVCCVKFLNSLFFSVLILYSAEAYPAVVRSLGHSFTLTLGCFTTVIVPFLVEYINDHFEFRNALCFLAPFGFFGVYICFLMPDATCIN
jgi:hypothetical protein